MDGKKTELSLLFKIPIWIYHTIALSVLWFVCSLPILTFPAASAAAYELAADIYTDYSMNIFLEFIQYFLKRLRQSAVLALQMAAFWVLTGLSLAASLQILPFGVLGIACTAAGVVVAITGCMLSIAMPVYFHENVTGKEIWLQAVQVIYAKYGRILLLLAILALCVYLCLEFYTMLLIIPTGYACIARYLLE